MDVNDDLVKSVSSYAWVNTKKLLHECTGAKHNQEACSVQKQRAERGNEEGKRGSDDRFIVPFDSPQLLLKYIFPLPPPSTCTPCLFLMVPAAGQGYWRRMFRWSLSTRWRRDSSGFDSTGLWVNLAWWSPWWMAWSSAAEHLVRKGVSAEDFCYRHRKAPFYTPLSGFQWHTGYASMLFLLTLLSRGAKTEVTFDFGIWTDET